MGNCTNEQLISYLKKNHLIHDTASNKASQLVTCWHTLSNSGIRSSSTRYCERIRPSQAKFSTFLLTISRNLNKKLPYGSQYPCGGGWCHPECQRLTKRCIQYSNSHMGTLGDLCLFSRYFNGEFPKKLLSSFSLSNYWSPKLLIRKRSYF